MCKIRTILKYVNRWKLHENEIFWSINNRYVQNYVTQRHAQQIHPLKKSSENTKK